MLSSPVSSMAFMPALRLKINLLESGCKHNWRRMRMRYRAIFYCKIILAHCYVSNIYEYFSGF